MMYVGRAAMILLPLHGELQPVPMQYTQASSHSEVGESQWVYDHAQAVGRGTDTLPSAQSLYLPLLSPNGSVRVVAIRHQDASQSRMPEYRVILENYSTLY